jgi:hypothetical protein
MYAKCGSMEDAWRGVDKMSSHDVISWTAIILDMWNVVKGRRHWNFFNRCKGNLWS